MSELLDTATAMRIAKGEPESPESLPLLDTKTAMKQMAETRNSKLMTTEEAMKAMSPASPAGPESVEVQAESDPLLPTSEPRESAGDAPKQSMYNYDGHVLSNIVQASIRGELDIQSQPVPEDIPRQQPRPEGPVVRTEPGVAGESTRLWIEHTGGMMSGHVRTELPTKWGEEVIVDPRYIARPGIENTVGLAKGAGAAAIGVPAFMLGMFAATGTLIEETSKVLTSKTDLDADKAFEIANTANKVLEGVMHGMTPMPKAASGQDVMEIVSWPFAKIHEAVDKAGDHYGWTEDQKGAAHLATDMLILAGPKVTKVGIKTGQAGIEKLRTWRKGDQIPELTPDEIKFFNALQEDWSDIQVLKEVEKLETEKKVKRTEEDIAIADEVEKIEAEVRAEEAELVGEKEIIEPDAVELMAEEKLLNEDLARLKKEERLLQLKDLHEQWKRERVETVRKIEEEIAPKEAEIEAVAEELAESANIPLSPEATERTRDRVAKVLAREKKKAEEARTKEQPEVAEHHEAVVEAVKSKPKKEAKKKIEPKSADPWERERAGAYTNDGWRIEKEGKVWKVTSPDGNTLDGLRTLREAKAAYEVATDTATDKIYPKDQNVSERLVGDVHYTDRATTLERANVYETPEAQKRAGQSPEFALNKLVNDVNRYIHGENVDISQTRQYLNRMLDNVDNFESFYDSTIDGERSFAWLKKSIEEANQFAAMSEPMPDIKDVRGQGGVTLASGIDPGLLKPMVKEIIDKSKKLVGMMTPDRALSVLKSSASPHELNVLGITKYLEDAKREGRKVSRDELRGLTNLSLKLEVDTSSYKTLARAFPELEGYENHIYRWEGNEFHPDPGHYYGPNIAFSTRISKVWGDTVQRIDTAEFTNRLNSIAAKYKGFTDALPVDIRRSEKDGLRNLEQGYAQEFRNAARIADIPLSIRKSMTLGRIRALVNRALAHEFVTMREYMDLMRDLRRYAGLSNKTERSVKAYVVEELQSDYFQQGGTGLVSPRPNSALVTRYEQAVGLLRRVIDSSFDIFSDESRAFTEESMARNRTAIDSWEIPERILRDPDLKSKFELGVTRLVSAEILRETGKLDPAHWADITRTIVLYLDELKNPPKSGHYVPFEKTWGRNGVELELLSAIEEQVPEFRWSTAENVIDAEGITKKETINMITRQYDSAMPKHVEAFFKKYGEKVKAVRSDSSGLAPSKRWAKAMEDLLALRYEMSKPLNSGSGRRYLRILAKSARETLSKAQMINRLEPRLYDRLDIVGSHVSKIRRMTNKSEYFTRENVARELNELERHIRALSEYEVMEGDYRTYWSVKIPKEIREKIYSKVSTEKHSISLASGLDLNQASDSVKSAFAYLTRGGVKAQAAELIRRAKTGRKKLGAQWVDKKIDAITLLDKHNSLEAHVVHRQLSLQQGATAEANIRADLMKKSVFGRKTRKGQKFVDMVMFLRRVVAIDKARAEEAIRTGKHRKVRHPKPSTADMIRLGLDPNKPIEIDGIVASEALNFMKQQLGDRFNDYNTRATIGFNFMKDMLALLHEDGIIDTANYNRLKGIDYLRRKDILEAIDPIREYTIGSNKIRVRESGVNVLKKGNYDDRLELDSELLMREVINSTYNRIFANRTNKALREFAEAHPDNGFVSVPKKVTHKDPNKKPTTKKVKNGWTRVDLFIDGKKEHIDLRNDFAVGWVKSNREISFGIARAAQIASGSALLKPTATGMNPGFAVANLMKDSQHVFLTSQIKIDGKWQSVYSSAAPKFTAQYAKDLAEVASDSFKREGQYLDAASEGMMMEFLSGEGSVWRRRGLIEGPLDRMVAFIGHTNLTSELLGRLALRRRAMKLQAKRAGIPMGTIDAIMKAKRGKYVKGRKIQGDMSQWDPALIKQVEDIGREASFVARDYMDFSNKGTWSEAVDTVVPYFAASIQGTRGLFRMARRRPIDFTAKLGQVVAGATALYMYHKSRYSEEMDRVPEIVKDNNYVIMTGHTFHDEYGQRRNLYFTLPKDPGQRVFTKLVETAIERHYFGNEDVDIPSTLESVKMLGPVENVMPVPLIHVITRMFHNLDLRKTLEKEDPVPVYKGPRHPTLDKRKEVVVGTGQYDTPDWAIGMADKMSDIAESIGSKSTFSPEGLNRAVEAAVARGLWTDLSGMAASAALGGNEEVQQYVIADAVHPDGESWVYRMTKMPISRRFMKLTAPEGYTQKEADNERDAAKKFESAVVDAQMRIKLRNYLLGNEGDINDLRRYAVSMPEHRENLMQDIDFALKLSQADPSYRQFWLRMRRPMNNEVKAGMFYDRLKAANAEEHANLLRDKSRFGYITDNFNVELNKIMRAEGMEVPEAVKRQEKIQEIPPKDDSAVKSIMHEEHKPGHMSTFTKLDDGSIGKAQANRDDMAHPYAFYVKGKGWEVDRGYGELIGSRLTKQAAMEMVKNTPSIPLDAARAKIKVKLDKERAYFASALPQLSQTRLDILAMMKYQGIDPLKWPKAGKLLRQAAQDGNNATIRKFTTELLDSDWAKRQTPGRARRMALAFLRDKY